MAVMLQLVDAVDRTPAQAGHALEQDFQQQGAVQGESVAFHRQALPAQLIKPVTSRHLHLQRRAERSLGVETADQAFGRTPECQFANFTGGGNQQTGQQFMESVFALT
ncbi:hypothetical protein D3C80_828760 [compost metagenome]